MSDIQVTTENGKVYLTSPYNPALPPKARALGGRWDGPRKAWRFDARDEARVRDLASDIYGTDGSPEDMADLVTVRVRLADHQTGSHGEIAEFGGRRIAERRQRDTNVTFAPGVVLVAGRLSGSGGSVRNPRIDAADDVIVEIRDIPRAALSVEADDSYEIVSDTAPASPDVDALMAERERLLARLAEIDALLPEPEGTEATTRDAATALGVSVRTVQRWAAQGKVEARKDDRGRWLITITI